MISDDENIILEDIKNKLKNHEKSVIGFKKIKKASIIIPLVILNDKINVLFEVRSKNLSSQPGDVCFPGGKIERNEQPKDAAIREIREELGINNINLLKELDLFIRYDGLMLYSYLGIVNNNESIVINSSEVDHTFMVPLDFFIQNEPDCFSGDIISLRSADFPYEMINGKENYNFAKGRYDTYFYKYEGYTIWGLTAAIINNFVKIIKK